MAKAIAAALNRIGKIKDVINLWINCLAKDFVVALVAYIWFAMVAYVVAALIVALVTGPVGIILAVVAGGAFMAGITNSLISGCKRNGGG